MGGKEHHQTLSHMDTPSNTLTRGDTTKYPHTQGHHQTLSNTQGHHQTLSHTAAPPNTLTQSLYKIQEHEINSTKQILDIGKVGFHVGS